MIELFEIKISIWKYFTKTIVKTHITTSFPQSRVYTLFTWNILIKPKYIQTTFQHPKRPHPPRIRSPKICYKTRNRFGAHLSMINLFRCSFRKMRFPQLSTHPFDYVDSKHQLTSQLMCLRNQLCWAQCKRWRHYSCRRNCLYIYLRLCPAERI